MEKDVKVEDIAQDVNKITDEELKSVQDQVNSINQVQLQIGGLEVQKSFALQQITTLQNKLNETQKELEEKYGKVSVNLQDGTIKPIEENEPNKED
jgi:allophanate hydrolase subunit 1|tara:strand:+ start:1126 stop:1413 length:288 start_codon:yes stop_codon:yes gene_type:complete